MCYVSMEIMVTWSMHSTVQHITKHCTSNAVCRGKARQMAVLLALQASSFVFRPALQLGRAFCFCFLAFT